MRTRPMPVDSEIVGTEVLMTRSGHYEFFLAIFRSAIAVLMGMAVLGVIDTSVARAQTYTVIHSFSGPDGANPQAGLTIDRAGNL